MPPKSLLTQFIIITVFGIFASCTHEDITANPTTSFEYQTHVIKLSDLDKYPITPILEGTIEGKFISSSEKISIDPQTGTIDLLTTYKKLKLEDSDTFSFHVKYMSDEHNLHTFPVSLRCFANVNSIPAKILNKSNHTVQTNSLSEGEEEPLVAMP
ncbi:hypothetical protein [Flavivirga algicola]|uniref:Lipoprotein n=1 Tax=Flavivirga algicola TaxID=2729136 RepID=A0ABX1S1K5_9FLAO|nr:hypothetical protein [Flavivirga algicola]NMH89760.1 hypothetical protein [Flavivirga algicola]